MKALIDLRSNTNWAKLYFDTNNPLTLTLNEFSLMRYYFGALVLVGIKTIEILPSGEEEDLTYIQELAMFYGVDIVFLERDSTKRDTYFSFYSDSKSEYNVIIEGAMYIPGVKVLKRLVRRQAVYIGEYRDNIGGKSSCLMTLSDYYRHMVKCINPKSKVRPDRTEIIGTLFTHGIEFGKGLYFKDKIIIKNRIIDPINNFFLQIEDRNIINC
jgi:hypothetical protein